MPPRRRLPWSRGASPRLAARAVKAWGSQAERLLDVADGLRRTIVHAADPPPDRLVALRSSLRKIIVEGGKLLGADGAIGRAAAAFAESHARFDAALDVYQRVAATSAPIDDPRLPEAAQIIAVGIGGQTAQLNAWTAWRRARQAALDCGLVKLVDAIEAGGVVPGTAVARFETAHARWWAERAIDAEPAVRDFTLAEQVDAIARFRDLDRQVAELTQLYIRAKLSGDIPPKDAQKQPPGFGALAHQLKLQKRHKPVRQLVSEMGPALTALAPCLLMSPLSVAQFLPPEAALFDLVIFDEASQITPWDAVGAIARGRQLVVAGDPKQMPPTSFFNRGAGAEDDDSEVETDQESILEKCLGARLPQRRLTWHYRSRNESLIAFSNHR